MAKVKITGHASGTGVITLTAPNTSTDRTVTLPDADVTLGASPVTALNNATANELVTVGATTTELDAEANLTFDGTDLTLGTGDIVFATAGKGICLGVTSNTDANTLDDYEEGNWTPTWSPTGGSWSGTGVGKYTKIGRQVTASFIWTASGQATGSKFNSVGGLPFTSLNETTKYPGVYTMNGGGADGYHLMPTMGANATTVGLQMQPDGTGTHGEFTPAQTGSSCVFCLTITYMTA
jgi:hypothetical protein